MICIYIYTYTYAWYWVYIERDVLCLLNPKGNPFPKGTTGVPQGSSALRPQGDPGFRNEPRVTQGNHQLDGFFGGRSIAHSLRTSKKRHLTLDVSWPASWKHLQQTDTGWALCAASKNQTRLNKRLDQGPFAELGSTGTPPFCKQSSPT